MRFHDMTRTTEALGLERIGFYALKLRQTVFLAAGTVLHREVRHS
jgi:hypothetical protein